MLPPNESNVMPIAAAQIMRRNRVNLSGIVAYIFAFGLFYDYARN